MHSELIEQPEAVEVLPDYRRQILIVEDDRSIAEVLALRLEQQGYDPMIAHTGKTGLELAFRHLPDLVLLDVRLPDADGFEICLQLDDDPTTCGIPKIIITAMEQANIVRRARAAGSQYYIRKPYDPNALLALIETALRQQCDLDPA